jgi:hypothetical protein
MEVFVDNFTERTTRSKTVKYLNFNVVFSDDDFIVYSMGWQVFGGIINPPSYSKGGRFFPNLNLSPALAARLYNRVLEKLPEGHTLDSEAEVVDGLTLTKAEFKRLYPKIGE